MTWIYWALSLAVVFISILWLLGGETLWLIRHTLLRDIRLGFLLLRIKRKVNSIKEQNGIAVTFFDKTAATHAERPMFKFQGKIWTYEEVAREANSIACYFQQLGLQKGDCVALLMENSPHLVIYWLGLAKIGVISALINFNQRQKPLVHSFKICNAKSIVCSETLLDDALQPIRDELSGVDDSMIFVHSAEKDAGEVNNNNVYKTINEETKAFEGKPFTRPALDYNDTVLYIFTSGTTGLPKAAKVKNSRVISVSLSFISLLKTTHNDVIWSPLPFYHSNAGLVGVGQAILSGACLAFRPKFSASNFWKDIIQSEATMFVYLGEICRYIYAQPRTNIETQHKLRIIFGAGLKKEIWKPFLERFQIPDVLEIYGSTEGNANLANVPRKEGACGFTSRLFSRILPVNLIKVDEEGNFIRDSNGICVKCEPGEPGQLVGKIVDKDPVAKFDGYIGSEETNKKIARDVFTKGDRAFMTGDTMVMDREGYLYFKDRTGDTFRWKGENVSTTEVEGVLFPAVNQKDVIVFGVEIPNCDGKAGMAAILNDEDNVNMDFLTAAINKNLPSYARPMFIRLLASSENHLTGTYKLRKVDLAKEGFLISSDNNNNSDMFFYYDVKNKIYNQLNENAKNSIITGQIKF